MGTEREVLPLALAVVPYAVALKRSEDTHFRALVLGADGTLHRVGTLKMRDHSELNR